MRMIPQYQIAPDPSHLVQKNRKPAQEQFYQQRIIDRARGAARQVDQVGRGEIRCRSERAQRVNFAEQLHVRHCSETPADQRATGASHMMNTAKRRCQLCARCAHHVFALAQQRPERQVRQIIHRCGAWPVTLQKRKRRSDFCGKTAPRVIGGHS